MKRTLRVRAGEPGASSIDANIRLCVRDRALGAALSDAIGTAVADALPSPADLPPLGRVLTVRTRARAAGLDAARVAGAFVLVPVTQKSAPHLLAIVTALRAKNPAGVQLVWGDDPRAEPHVFAVLEHVRATPREAPVVLAACDEPVVALRVLALGRSPQGKAHLRC